MKVTLRPHAPLAAVATVLATAGLAETPVTEELKEPEAPPVPTDEKLETFSTIHCGQTYTFTDFQVDPSEWLLVDVAQEGIDFRGDIYAAIHPDYKALLHDPAAIGKPAVFCSRDPERPIGFGTFFVARLQGEKPPVLFLNEMGGQPIKSVLAFKEAEILAKQGGHTGGPDCPMCQKLDAEDAARAAKELGRVPEDEMTASALREEAILADKLVTAIKAVDPNFDFPPMPPALQKAYDELKAEQAAGIATKESHNEEANAIVAELVAMLYAALPDTEFVVLTEDDIARL